jgi:RNA polymerase sigma factor (sigma-70 family)
MQGTSQVVQGDVEIEFEDTAAISPADALLRKEMHETVRRCLEKVTEKNRLAVLHLEMQGMPVSKIAGILGISKEAVKTRACRGRGELRKMPELQQYLRGE